jgi:Protein kinase domain
VRMAIPDQMELSVFRVNLYRLKLAWKSFPQGDLAKSQHGFPSQKIGKYDVEGIIGRGGMGVVYKAIDPQIGRYVAIKMITSGGDESLIERFKSEARSTGSLQCPNIVTVYNVGEQDGNPYLVMGPAGATGARSYSGGTDKVCVVKLTNAQAIEAQFVEYL